MFLRNMLSPGQHRRRRVRVRTTLFSHCPRPRRPSHSPYPNQRIWFLRMSHGGLISLQCVSYFRSLFRLLIYFQIHTPIFLVIMLFPISTAFVFWCLSTLPISLSWPHNIADLAQIGRELHGYSQSGPGPLSHVIGVMAISAIWKHAWSIPGSVLWVRSLSYFLIWKAV